MNHKNTKLKCQVNQTQLTNCHVDRMFKIQGWLKHIVVNVTLLKAQSYNVKLIKAQMWKREVGRQTQKDNVLLIKLRKSNVTLIKHEQQIVHLIKKNDKQCILPR